MTTRVSLAFIVLASPPVWIHADPCDRPDSSTGYGRPFTSERFNNDGNIAATITITSTGVSPTDVTVSAGQRVQFVNNDTQSHTINSNPHPTHGDCPSIDSVGFIAIGQTKATSNLNTVRTCGYHDHVLFSDARFQGTIRVQ